MQNGKIEESLRRFVSGRRGAAVLLAFFFIGAGIVLTFRLGAAPVTLRSEWRCWRIVRTMYETGDWLIPRRMPGGPPSVNKPPLFYWTATSIAKITGGVSLTSFRLTSVIMAFGLLLLTYYWGKTLGGVRYGLLAAGLLLGMMTIYRIGRLGTFEMELALLDNAALFAFDRCFFQKRNRLVPLFAILTVLAFMTKGPPAFLVIGLPIVFFLWRESQLRRIFRKDVLPWLLLIIPLVLAWFIAVIIKDPQVGRIFYREGVLPLGVKTAKHTAMHYKPFYYFLYKVLVIAAPVSLLFGLAIKRGWRERLWRENRRLYFLALIFILPFIAFSIFPQKQQHYILPLMPALAMIFSESVLWFLSAEKKQSWWWLGILPAFCAFAFCIVGTTFFLYLYVILQTNLALCILWLLIYLSLSLWILRAGINRRWLTAGLVGLVLFWGVVMIKTGSFDVLDAQFYHGIEKNQPRYNREHWQKLFQKYPFLKRIFKEHRRKWWLPKKPQM